MRIFIACPANFATGGTELLHQLSWHLSNRGIENYMLYWNVNPVVPPTPDVFMKYQVKYVVSFIDDEQSVLIVPETGIGIFRVCQKGMTIIWWLSVDNYFLAYHNTIAQAGKADIFGLKDRSDVIHLVQSKYAYHFVQKEFGIREILYLGDYINDDIVKIGTEYRDQMHRENICLYNPKKGAENLKEIMGQCRKDIQWIPLQGLSPEQMALLMCRAKVYIDFGNHPGKDRIPREAAVCGCCVITNREGSASFAEDVGIPEEYKLLDMHDYSHILNTIYDLTDNYEKCAKRYDTYIAAILNEKEEFEKEIDFMLGEVRNKILNHSLQWKGGQYNGLFGSIQKSVAKVYSLYEASQRLYADQKIDESVKELLKVENVLSALRETNYMVIEDMLVRDETQESNGVICQ